MADLLSARQKGFILENRAIAGTRASRMRDNKTGKIMIDERLQDDKSDEKNR